LHTSKNKNNRNRNSSKKISDSTVNAKTGKDWNQWFSLLDKENAKEKSHK
jgi:hypothetical protein